MTIDSYWYKRPLISAPINVHLLKFCSTNKRSTKQDWIMNFILDNHLYLGANFSNSSMFRPFWYLQLKEERTKQTKALLLSNSKYQPGSDLLEYPLPHPNPGFCWEDWILARIPQEWFDHTSVNCEKVSKNKQNKNK